MKSSALWLLMIVVCIPSAHASTQRRHYRITSAGPDAAARYTVTEIVSSDGRSPDRRTYLLQDSNGDRLVLTETVDPRRNELTREIRDLGTNEYVRSTVPQTGSGEESARLWLELNGVSVLTTRREALLPSWRESRSKLRRSAGPAFVERLERMRGIPGAGEILSGFCEHLLRFVLYNEACTPKMVVTAVRPDCDFDALFRYPCTDAQKKAVKRMPSNGNPKY